jgi:hypothetical protein
MYLDLLIIINSCLVILLLNQDAIILILGIIITRGIVFLSAEIYFITIIEKQFSRILVYISLILIRIIISFSTNIQTRAPFLFILYINLL